MPHVRRKPECPERPASLHQEVAHTPSDQHSNDVVVEGPPGLVAGRHGMLDDAHHVVDDGCRCCQRSTVFITSDRDCYLRTLDSPADIAQPSLQLRLRQRGAWATNHPGEIVDCEPRVAHHLAVDPSARSPCEVGPQCLAMTSTQIVRMVLREKQCPAAKPGPGKDAQRPLVEVLVESLAGRRSREHHVYARRSQQEQDQGSEALGPPHRGCHQSCERARPDQKFLDRECASSRDPWAAVPDPPIGPPL